MSKNIALKVASIVFLLVAVLHALRLFFKWDMVIDGYAVSMEISIAGLVVALVLSLWMYIASRR